MRWKGAGGRGGGAGDRKGGWISTQKGGGVRGDGGKEAEAVTKGSWGLGKGRGRG